MTEEFSFGDGKKLNINDFRREIKESKLKSDEKFKMILSAFDANNDGITDDGDIDTLFGTMKNYAAKNGNSVFENNEISDFLNETKLNGKSLSANGIGVNELLGFFKNNNINQTQTNKQNTTNTETQITSDEIKDETINFIKDEYTNGMKMLNGYDPGYVSKGYSKIKEFLGSSLSKSNVARNLYVKLETSELLKRAKNGELSYKDYYGAIKQTLYDIFPHVQNMKEKDKKELKQRLNSMSPEQIERTINHVLNLPNPNSSNYKDALIDFRNNFVEETSTAHSIVRDGKTITTHTINKAYSLDDSDRIITFEEVFKNRYGTTYDEQKYSELIKENHKLSLVSSTFNNYQKIYADLHEQIITCEGLMEPGNQNKMLENQHNIVLQNNLIDILNKLGLASDEDKNNFIAKFAPPNIEIKNGKFSDKNNPDENDSKLQLTTNIEMYTMVNIAKNLLAELEKNSPTKSDIEKQSAIVDRKYRALFGDKDTDRLVNAYIEDTESSVQGLRTGIEVIGGVSMVAGMFFCAPLAVTGAIIGGVGGIGTEALNEIGRKQPSGEKLKELGVELAQNIALFVTGAGAGKAGMSARAFLIAQKCPKLVASIADVGIDVTLSAISNLVLIGDLQLESEGFSQIISLIAGHIKAGRFKIHKKPKADVEQITPKPGPKVDPKIHEPVVKAEKPISPELTPTERLKVEKAAKKAKADEKVSNKFKALLDDIGVKDENTKNLLTRFMMEASSRIDSDTQVDITNAQLNFIKSRGATSENTFILAPQPTGTANLKSYTNAARDLIEISQTGNSSLKLNPDNATVKIVSKQLFPDGELGKKFIVISDDCSISGASILEDGLKNISLGNNLKTGQNVEIVFSPTVIGTNAQKTINRFIDLYNKITPDEIRELEKRTNKSKKSGTPPDLDGLSQNAIDMYNIIKKDITDNHNDRNQQNIIISNLKNFKCNKGGKISISLADVSDSYPMQKAIDYRETDFYRKASPDERDEIDTWMTADGQSWGYRQNATIVSIEGYRSNGYDFIGNTSHDESKRALGIDKSNQTRSNLPVRGNAPNNNTILTQIFAKAMGVDDSRIKISGVIPATTYYKIMRHNLATFINPTRINGQLTGKTISVEFEIKKGGLSDGKITICGKEYDAANCKIEIMTESGDVLYAKTLQGVPKGTSMAQTAQNYRSQLNPDVINDSEVSVLYGSKKIEDLNDRSLEDIGLQENYVFAVPKNVSDKIVVKVNGEVVIP